MQLQGKKKEFAQYLGKTFLLAIFGQKVLPVLSEREWVVYCVFMSNKLNNTISSKVSIDLVILSWETKIKLKTLW